MVGYARFEGEQAYRQLGEVYQALRLYVNGFQPSMKLQAKQDDGRKVRRIYDAAKTPLQRLLLSHMFPVSKEHELQQVAQVLDPLCLFHHVQNLQQALVGFTTSASSVTVLPFCIERCLGLVGPTSSQTEDRELQKQSSHAFITDPVPSSQPEQNANSCAHTLHQEEAHPSPRVPSQHPEEEGLLPPQPIIEEKEASCPPLIANDDTAQNKSKLSHEPLQPFHVSVNDDPSRSKFSNMALAQTIQEYLEDQRHHHRRPKTLEWHEQALGLFQRYLLAEHQCVSLSQITEEFVRGWFAALSQTPMATGALRSPGTVASYARSARAFCQWLVRHRYLQTTPFVHLPLPPGENRLLHSLEPEEWEQVLRACHAPKEMGMIANRAAARNRTILWILFETGMHVTEICHLRLEDVDREHGVLRVQGTGLKARWLTLGHEGWSHLVAYLEEYRFKEGVRFEQRGTRSEPLFLSETGRPLTKSAVALVFNRLRQRVGVSQKNIRASLVRESFAVRYLQTGGDRQTLLELLGQQKSAIIVCSVGEK